MSNYGNNSGYFNEGNSSATSSSPSANSPYMQDKISGNNSQSTLNK
jgi:hypothetical protein